MRCRTGSQWSVSRMNSLICPNLGTPPIILAVIWQQLVQTNDLHCPWSYVKSIAPNSVSSNDAMSSCRTVWDSVNWHHGTTLSSRAIWIPYVCLMPSFLISCSLKHPSNPCIALPFIQAWDWPFHSAYNGGVRLSRSAVNLLHYIT